MSDKNTDRNGLTKYNQTKTPVAHQAYLRATSMWQIARKQLYAFHLRLWEKEPARPIKAFVDLEDRDTLRTAMRAAGLDPDNPRTSTAVILVGGPTRPGLWSRNPDRGEWGYRLAQIEDNAYAWKIEGEWVHAKLKMEKVERYDHTAVIVPPARIARAVALHDRENFLSLHFWEIKWRLQCAMTSRLFNRDIFGWWAEMDALRKVFPELMASADETIERVVESVSELSHRIADKKREIETLQKEAEGSAKRLSRYLRNDTEFVSYFPKGASV